MADHPVGELGFVVKAFVVLHDVIHSAGTHFYNEQKQRKKTFIGNRVIPVIVKVEYFVEFIVIHAYFALHSLTLPTRRRLLIALMTNALTKP